MRESDPDLRRTTLTPAARPDGQRSGDKGPSIYPGMEDAGIGTGAPDEDLSGDFSDDDLYDDDFDDPDTRDDDFGGAEARGDLGGDETDGDFGSGSAAERRRRRGPYLFISVAFALLFLLLMLNLVYFHVFRKDEILNSPYNRRQNSLNEHIIRGDIRSSDGATLARTDVWEDGTEERVYPYANVFAHTVGFATHGKSGIESFANYQLLTSHTNIIDRIINEFRNRKNPGDTVVTTLDASLQESCYYALGDYRGAIIVMEPKTGAVRAMVSKPDFDPNMLDSVWDEMVSDSGNSQLLNRATQGLYPPGSTFKIVTALSYYRRFGDFSRFRWNCEGELQIEDSVIHCYNGTVHGEETLEDAFANSCNTAFAEIGLELGRQYLTSTAKDLLFGSRLPSELYSSRTRWQLDASSDETDLVQTAFGQGKTLTTPYHMALIASAIANGGVLMEPYLIERIENRSGDVVSETKPKRYTTLMTADESAKIAALMTRVAESGTASELADRGFRAAGKTGSAEYLKNDGTIGTHSWFVGYTNPEDPEVVVAVLAENGGAGSSTAVPIAAAVLEAYYGY